ncbi:ABC transporter ATP-binding protein [Desulfosoma caldarium]|uniref:Iron complex transport system ATP-binding protein n=1 Tax=Desulfosoma caldarium TaxID=610254 RepID=A0A3N1USS6_9BACT|nr:ABC transporter ATP-binding protein [Desulfosoma caldarium]ROQ93193.1 iron complex transport system ATP-binding protein [Desulfosoma caldarium]
MILSVLDIAFQYNSHAVLQGVRFDVSCGELVAVCGTNGAGKSTLLRCLNGMLQPRVGTVLLEGEDLRVLGRRGVARAMASVPQKGKDSELTVFEVVLLGVLPHRRWGPTRQDVQSVEKILTSMNLAALAHRRFSTLSGGEAQKVLLAKALAQKPKVLLLDEPTNHLDLKNQLEMMQLVRRISRQQSLAVVAAIHDLNLALRYCDRILFLKGGRIETAVTPGDVTAELVRRIYGVDVKVCRIEETLVVVPKG